MKNEAAACVLLLDTSGDTGTVALAVKGEVRVVARMERARDYAAVLNETVDAVLKEAGATMDELTALCVLAGPGSYTGLRIALAAAKGWCYVLDIPLVLQNKLHVLAEDARAAKPNLEAYVAILQARASEYFFAAYDSKGDALVEPRHLKLAEATDVLQTLPPQFMVIGSELAHMEIFSSENLSGRASAAVSLEIPSLETWLYVALTQIRAGHFADLAYAEPFYLKAAYTTTPKASR
jgi:tRNA threonylcarbamoyladenosine biosynthesis protein TsaB